MNVLPSLVKVYSILLDIPEETRWRCLHQHIYAELRNSIALLTNTDVESVQNFCEAVVKANKENN